MKLQAFKEVDGATNESLLTQKMFSLLIHYLGGIT
jgi:hypothetical protein